MEKEDQMLGSKPKNIKQNNIKVLLYLFYEHKSLCIQDASKLTGMSKTTVIKLLNGLLEKGIIISCGKGHSTTEGGRKPEMFLFNADYRVLVSLELDETGVFFRIMDLFLKPIYEYKTTQLSVRISYSAVLEELGKALALGLEKINSSYSQIACIVVNGTGIIDTAQGVILNSIGRWGANIPIAQDILRMLPIEIPILVNNISRFSGFAELAENHELKRQRVATILVWDEWVGGSIIDNGKLSERAHSLIGEFGHMTVANNLDFEDIGAYSGQFEAMVSSKGLIEYTQKNGILHKESQLYGAIAANELTVDLLIQAANSGDELALKVLKRSAYYFALIIHFICIVYEPDTVILQGFYNQMDNYFVSDIYMFLEKLMPFYNIRGKLKIVQSNIDYTTAFHTGAGLIGVDDLLSEVSVS